MKELLIILFSAILVDNFVLSRFLGICPFLGVSKNVKTAMGMSTAVIVVMVIASALTWPVQFFILYPLNLGISRRAFSIVIIASLVQIHRDISAQVGPIALPSVSASTCL